MNKQQREKQYQFVKLLSELTKQGFHFVRVNGTNILRMNRKDAHRLLHHETKTPFVEYFRLCEVTYNDIECELFQWSDRKFKKTKEEAEQIISIL